MELMTFEGHTLIFYPKSMEFMTFKALTILFYLNIQFVWTRVTLEHPLQRPPDTVVHFLQLTAVFIRVFVFQEAPGQESCGASHRESELDMIASLSKNEKSNIITVFFTI